MARTPSIEMTTDSEEAFDPSVLLAELGDRAFVAELARMFLDLGPAMHAEVVDELARGRLEDASRAAHRIKSALVHLGAGPAARAAARVEHGLRAGDVPSATAAAEVLTAEVKRLEPALRRFVEAGTQEDACAS